MKRKFHLSVALLLFSFLWATAQTEFTGTVENSRHEPIIGATVWPEGREDLGVTTDFNGTFTLKVPSDVDKVRVRYIGYAPRSVKVGSVPATIILAKHTYIKPTTGYIGLGAGIGSFANLSATLGGYIHNFNIEVFYNYCLEQSPRIYWNNIDWGITENHERYKPYLILGGKVGYGIKIGNRVSITPQAGYRFSNLRPWKNSIDMSYCSSLSIGARAYFAILPNFGFSLTPEYYIAVAKGNTFKTLSDVSSKIKSFGEGFNVNLSIVCSL